MSRARESEAAEVTKSAPARRPAPAASGSAAALLRMQRAAGNAAVTAMVGRRAASTVAAAPARPAAEPQIPAGPPVVAPATGGPALDEAAGGEETTPEAPRSGLGDGELASLDVDAPAPPDVTAGVSAEVDAIGADAGPEPAAGGGGGGAPVEEPPAPAPPNVAAAPPEQAMAQLGALPPGQMAATLGGVQAAAGATVAQEQGRLAAAPPSHTPLANTPTLTTAASSLVPADGPAHQARVGRAGPRTARPTPPPRPVAPAGPPATARVQTPALPAAPQGGLGADAARDLSASLSRLPVRDPGTQVAPGPAPRVSLTGDADPGQVHAQQAQLAEGTAQAQAEGGRDAAEPLGENAVHPTATVETMQAEVAPPAAAQEAPEAEPADAAVSAIAEEQQGPQLRAAAASASTAMTSARRAHAEQEQTQRQQSAQQIASLEQQHAVAEQSERTGVRAEVAEQRTQWRTEQRSMVTAAHTEAQAVVGTAGQTVRAEQQQAETEAAQHHQQGAQEAAAARREGEQEAARHRAEAQQESGGGFLGWLASRAQSLFDRVKQGITAAFDRARNAVRAAVEKAQSLATAVIDRARQAAVAAIRLAGTALTAIGDRLLAGFPALRDRFRNAIRDRVRRAEAAVNRLAEGLKSGVRAALGLLGRGLSALLSGLEAGLKAAVDGVAATVRGAIQAARSALEALGAFMVIAKDVAANPGAWLRNLGAAVMDGIRNHLWVALKTAIQQWFNDKVEQVLGLGRTVWNLLTRGGISLARIGEMAWQGIKQAIPPALIGILIEKLASMIMPAAGAVLLVIQGLQAAWGAVSRILQAINRFVAFLRAVKTGNGGQAFAEVVAAAAITVVDFVSNWLIARLARGASRIGNRIRAIAQRIGAAVRRVARRVGGALRRAGRWIGDRFRGVRDRVRGWRERRQRRRAESPVDRQRRLQDRLDRAVAAIEPAVNRLLSRGVGQLGLRARLLYWRVRHRLTSLEIKKSGDTAQIWAQVNPKKKVTQATALTPAQLRTVVNQAVRDVLRDPEIRRRLRSMRMESTENPGQLDVSGGEGWGAATQHLRGQGRNRPWVRDQRIGVHEGSGAELRTQESRSPWGGPANAYVRGMSSGSYPDIAAEFAKTGIDDRQLATHLNQLVRTGVAPRQLTPEQAQLLGHVSWLMFARESHRNRRNYAMAPMTLELVQSGRMTWQQAFTEHEAGGPAPRHGGRGMFPMSMEGAEGAARQLNPHDRPISVAADARPVTDETVERRRRNRDELEHRETQLVTMWLNMRLERDQGLVGLSAQAIGDHIRRMLREYYSRRA